MIYKLTLCPICGILFNWKLTAYEVGSEIMATMMAWGVSEQGWRKGPWTPEEDKLLSEYVSLHGEGRWSSVARSAGN